MRCRIPDRIWFWFLRFVHWFKRGRGSPRFTRLVDLAGSEKSKRLVVSHTRKGDFVHFGASLRIMYTAVAHRPTPRPLGIEAIPRLVNRVLSLFFMLSFSLSLSLSVFYFLSFVLYCFTIPCMFKICRTAHDKSSWDIDKPFTYLRAPLNLPALLNSRNIGGDMWWLKKEENLLSNDSCYFCFWIYSSMMF